jgi:tetratricopeptide (TPR) repeat protein
VDVTDPGPPGSLDEFINQLRYLKVWAGNPSITEITKGVCRSWRLAGRPDSELPARSTVGYCFQAGRPRPNLDLLLAIIAVLADGDPLITNRWRSNLLAVLSEADGASDVSAADRLPADLAKFIGRTDPVAAAVGVLTASDDSAVATYVCSGMAGIGKTAFAVHLGHRLLQEGVTERVLFVNLRGYDPHRPPADPSAVLSSFMRLLGVPGDRVPHGLARRINLYRHIVTTARALIVLDDATNLDQVTPLLPGSPTCPVLITSRDSLCGLSDAYHLQLPAFTPTESLNLLRRAVGPDRTDADADTAGRIADVLGHLPLALSVIGSHIRDHPDWTLADYPPALTPLALEGGVRAALALSDTGLPPESRRLLRLLALHPGDDCDLYAAAALVNHDTSTTVTRLRVLVAANLLLEEVAGRYRLHDLVRAYAIERASVDDPRSLTEAAFGRLYDHYAQTASNAMSIAYPHNTARRPRVPIPATRTPDLADRDAALAWLDIEQGNLLAAAQHAPAYGRLDHVLHQSATLQLHLFVRGVHTAARQLHEMAADLAGVTGNQSVELVALNDLGLTHRMQGRYDLAAQCHVRAMALARTTEDSAGKIQALLGLGDVHHVRAERGSAIDYYTQALDLARQTSNRSGEAQALIGLGYIHNMSGAYQPAIGYYTYALELARSIDNPVSELSALVGLGNSSRLQGNYQSAITYYSAAVQLSTDSGNLTGELAPLAGLGYIHYVLGEYELANDCHTRTLHLARATCNLTSELQALTGLGYIHLARGQHESARDCYQQALVLADKTGDRNWQCEAHQGLGRVYHAIDHIEHARAAHQNALSLATELNQPTDKARAHDGLAQVHYTIGEYDRARHHWQHALTILTQLNTPFADDIAADTIRVHLNGLDALTGP